MGFIYCFVEKMSPLIRSQNEMTQRNDGPSSLSLRSKGPSGVGRQKGCCVELLRPSGQDVGTE